MRTTRHPCHSQMRSHAPSKPWWRATFLLRFLVGLACGAAMLARLSSAVVATVLMELAGESRTTATGLFALSNQLGVFGGASLGGLMLALGGFALVGLFCGVVAVLAGVVIGLKVRESAAFLTQLALREGTPALE